MWVRSTKTLRKGQRVRLRENEYRVKTASAGGATLIGTKGPHKNRLQLPISLESDIERWVKS